MLKENKRAFLRAAWNDLIMANYAVDPACLQKLVPYGTELDDWNGKHYVSLVGFMFRDTAVMGIKVPLHTDFEEVNLRFYVRCKDNGEWKRGVVFVKEIVPLRAVAWVANVLYKEHYHAMPMAHSKHLSDVGLEVGYSWKFGGKTHRMSVLAEPSSKPMAEGSEEEFIAEHYWGFTKLDQHRTSAYQVEHPKWEVHRVLKTDLDFEAGLLYGDAFNGLERQKPVSVFLAKGSEISVRNKFSTSKNT